MLVLLLECSASWSLEHSLAPIYIGLAARNFILQLSSSLGISFLTHHCTIEITGNSIILQQRLSKFGLWSPIIVIDTIQYTKLSYSLYAGPIINGLPSNISYDLHGCTICHWVYIYIVAFYSSTSFWRYEYEVTNSCLLSTQSCCQ